MNPKAMSDYQMPSEYFDEPNVTVSSGQLPLAESSSSAIGVPDALRTRIKDLIRDAWQHGFNAEGPDEIGFIDEFSLADEALDEYWPNGNDDNCCLKNEQE